MGRTKTKKQAGAAQRSVDGPSVSALLDKAQSLIVQCDYDLASRFIQRALEHHPANSQAKEMLGVVQLELGDIDAAKQVGSSIYPFLLLVNLILQTFSSLLPPNPDAPSPPPPSAHLYLAQISDDDPQVALQHYRDAVELLSAQLKGKDRAESNPPSNDEVELKCNIVRALIGQVEVWMDPSYDLW